MPKINRNLISLKETYKFYKENAKGELLSYKEFKLVLDTWGSEFVNMLILGKDVKLQAGLSVFGVRKKKQFTYTDLKASKESGKRVLKPNTHSGNYGARVYWGRQKTKIDSRGWKFTPSRTLSRGISAVMKKFLGHTMYVKTHRVFDKTAKKMYRRNVLNIDI